ncbi:MAG: 3-hydroxyacyl-CoA dehydrogenase [Candidatus Kentron sp. G]|nr:MAG: 3-hydroxyacyl-CoA dehydrogenase [Candidatus Kentron sp. G]VFN06312.1 MAG: 3-hydroxyacyl-CoA dehydrogenase [Candidatus Kentron sp. G]VFN07116.1 MAG: 3-hydroxyacyl-CoA dehydrogenase [Candidatus Kentron sp. G]
MGAQIGMHCAVYGYSVSVFSRSEKTLQAAAQSHARELQGRVDNRQLTPEEQENILGRIQFTTDMKQAVAKADLVIENVPEDLRIKREVFARLDRLCPEHTILATDSSSLRVSLIEDATRRPDKVLNMHFFQPVWQRTVLELMGGTATTEETLTRSVQFVRTIGSTPLVAQKESTGFIFGRVWRAIKKECLRVVDEGVSSPEDVDRGWMINLGYPIGPFGLMDMVGLDVVRDVEVVYYRESGAETDAPPKFLLEKIERGELGIKTGKGFYTYPNPAFQSPDWLKGEL